MAEVQGVQGQRGVANPPPSVSLAHALGHLYDAVCEVSWDHKDALSKVVVTLPRHAFFAMLHQMDPQLLYQSLEIMSFNEAILNGILVRYEP